MPNRHETILSKATVDQLVSEIIDHLNHAETVAEVRTIDSAIEPLYDFARQRIEALEAAEPDRDITEKRRIAANEAAWKLKRGRAA